MLKSLELFGFKSFADRTLFEFSPGVTCVVGPNGSGKSNVVDAMKWILGDQSAKSLRGQEMSDVIFNGSAQRRASGFAEATLAFDNSAGLLPIDAAEVRVGRRLYQSGDSEYLVNGAPVRLKDVRDLFMGTGAGTAAYSIIEQGRVDQILQSNPTARRTVFEEAAGISKFKSRKEDAERRLERVAQNLLRLTDIVDQVESQLNTTRSQAGKAARFRELSQELKRLWTGLAADDCRILTRRLDELLDETESVGKKLADSQEQMALVAGRKAEADDRLRILEDELFAVEKEIAAIRQATAADSSTWGHQATRGVEIRDELSRLRRRRTQLAIQIRFADRELDETETRLTDFQLRCELGRAELSRREAELLQFEEIAARRQADIQAAEGRRNELRREQSAVAERLAGLHSQAESSGQAIDDHRNRLDELRNELQQADAERLRRKLRLAEAEAEMAQHHLRLADRQSLQLQLAERRDQTERQLADLRERRSAAEARLTLLSELENRQDGIAIGVRDILQRAKTSHYPPWNHVIGLVRDLIDVPVDLAPILDAALADRAQLVAVRRMGPFLEYFNHGSPPFDGRVGFVSLERSDSATGGEVVATDWDDVLDLSGHPGVHGRADRLVSERPDAHGLARRVLGDTWIVENIDVAGRLLEHVPQHIRFVTRQGEVLCGRELLYAGMLPHELSIVSRRSELRQLKNEIHQLNRGIDACDERLIILAEQIAQGLGELSGVEDDLRSLSTAVTRASAQLTEQERECGRLEKECRNQEQLVLDWTRRRESVVAELAELQTRFDGISASLQKLSDELTADLAWKQDFDSNLAQAARQVKTEQVELARHESQLAGLREAQSRLARGHADRQRQFAELTDTILELRQSLSRSELEILKAQDRIAHAAWRLGALTTRERKLAAERQRLRDERNAVVQEEEVHHRESRDLLDRRRELDFEIQKCRHQVTTLADRIHDEYQITLEQLLDSDLSAYRDLLRERYGMEGSPAGDAGSDVDAAEPNEAPAGSDRLAASYPKSDADVRPKAVPFPEFSEVRGELEAEVDRLRRKIKAIGHVNTEALDDLDEMESRFAALSHQLGDLREAKAALEDIIRRINQESRRIFLATFETIRGHFQELFRKLFGGGNADILLEDPENVLDCGIEIVARPPGKELRSISLLSGGEKTMTAVAMLFAMFKSKPSPYCVLDEVDAALDEANVDRYVAVIKEFTSMTQFIVITHRKRTMTAADVLYGVTMEQAGVSKRISVRFEDVRENGEIRTAA